MGGFPGPKIVLYKIEEVMNAVDSASNEYNRFLPLIRRPGPAPNRVRYHPAPAPATTHPAPTCSHSVLILRLLVHIAGAGSRQTTLSAQY